MKERIVQLEGEQGKRKKKGRKIEERGRNRKTGKSDAASPLKKFII